MASAGSLAVLFAALLTSTSVLAAPKEDLVESLPSFGPPPTLQYSGFLDGTDGCDTATNGAFCKLHYWFAQAEGDASNKPVILWLNGGPGSSSILGFLQENGPLLMNATGGLMENPWSWTKVANLFVLEAPVGVGYSYCANQIKGKTCVNTDKYTASTSRAALVDFFSKKFPELAQNDFFITGESYAGVYIPTLAKEILEHAPQINLVGLAVGDPCTDNTAQKDSMDALWYSHKYGLVPDATFDLLWNHCNLRLPNKLMRAVKSRRQTASKNNEHDSENEFYSQLQNSGFVDSPQCKLAFRKFLLSTSRALSQSWRDMFIDDYSLFAPVTILEDVQMQQYMNSTSIRKALHVEESPIETWPYPNDDFNYTKEYDACNGDAKKGALSMIDFYRKIVPKLASVWVYNGDTDPCVSYEGTRSAIESVGFSEVDGGSYRPWFYNHTATTLQVLAEKAAMFGPDLLVQPTGAQFGGEVVNYENGLSFLTVHGSGHMVPQFRPQAALHMIQKLVSYQDLSPLLPSNETLTKMCDKGFSKSMDSWTEKAKGSPYVDQVQWESTDASIIDTETK
jgi:cathepsin A (carboxypeptidase C)